MLDDAKILAQMNGRKSIEDSDVRGVAKLKLDNYFTRPPPREVSIQTNKFGFGPIRYCIHLCIRNFYWTRILISNFQSTQITIFASSVDINLIDSFHMYRLSILKV